MIRTFKSLTLLSATALIGFNACSKDKANIDTTITPGEGNKVKYVIAAHPTSAEAGTADYLLTTDDLTKGSITTKGNGIEQDGTWRYYVVNQNKFFSMLYGQGNPGAVTSYALNADGKLVKVSNFVTETVQVFAPMNNELVLFKVPRSGNENSLVYRIDAVNPGIKADKEINIVKLAGNGERAHFTWATQFGDKLLAPYMSIKGCCGDTFGTAYPDSTWVAVLSFPDLKVEKVIKDNRTSYLGGYFKNGLFVDEQGDAYGFSGATVKIGENIVSKNPSAIVRIKKGTTEFDKSYFFNFEQKTNGFKINSARYIGKGKFLVQSYAQSKSTVGVKFAIADVYAQTVTWVTGAPVNISGTTSSNYGALSEDGTKAYVGLTLDTGDSYVYIFDTATNTATQGLKVEGGTINGIHRLTY
ncbi:DUF4374 domain-containing protein [Sphingobacterium spiritivorum]|uniref:DUF4374 domain-containing protein n=1 Tax=Sphingobacterium spiritivorum TaxID=258 RepID=UPI003DA5A272